MLKEARLQTPSHIFEEADCTGKFQRSISSSLFDSADSQTGRRQLQSKQSELAHMQDILTDGSYHSSSRT